MPFGGVFSVLPTPFSASGDVDLDSLRRIVDLFIADGVDGFTALGVTSEVALVKVVSLFRAGDVYEAAREFYAKVPPSYL